jgi:beta-galactosidase
MTKWRPLWMLGVLCWPVLVAAKAVGVEAPVLSGQPRVSVDLSRGWRFRQADGLSDVPSSAFDDSQWTAIEIPHTWNRIGNEGFERSPLSNNVQGVGWYRLRFKTPPSSAARLP